MRTRSRLTEATNIDSDLSNVFQLRNRLVHFQDDEFVAVQQSPPDELEAIFAAELGDHPFVSVVRECAVDQIFEDVSCDDGARPSEMPSSQTMLRWMDSMILEAFFRISAQGMDFENREAILSFCALVVCLSYHQRL